MRRGGRGRPRLLGIDHARRPALAHAGLVDADRGCCGSGPVLAGIWLMTLPALFTGVLGVLAPLRLSGLGASGVAVGAVWLCAAAVEAGISPIVGRVSDRRGRLVPIRWATAAACVMCVVIPLPTQPVLFALCVVAAFSALALFWAPAMALLSDAVEAAGLDRAGLRADELRMGGRAGLGGSGGAKLGETVGDALPYAICGALCAATLLALQSRGRRAQQAAA